MASKARTQHACEQASIRDLMARVISAGELRRECGDAEWNDADALYISADNALTERLMRDLDLNAVELRQLGGLL